MGRRTLVIDLDPQAHLTLSMNYEPEELTWTVVDLLDPDGSFVETDQVIQKTNMPGLDLLPGDQRLSELEWSLHDKPDYEHTLAQILETVKDQYDYVLMDCPPSMGALTLMALTAATFTMIPVQCDYFATRGLMRLLDIVNAVQQRTNPGLEYGLFVTLFDGRTLISRRIHEQLQQNFPNEIFETTIGMDTRLRESAMANEPIITYASKTRASSQYRSLATELIQRLEEKGKAS
jgi:chromosome partitioning protein